MNTLSRQLRKIKVIGYPFAGGQPRAGVDQTPAWLLNQPWFKEMLSSKKVDVEFEAVKVSNGVANSQVEDDFCHVETEVEAKNIGNVMYSSAALKAQTNKAIRDGFFPIVLGGDHSQAIGSVAGMKMARPDTRILWMDAHIDANTPTSSPSRNAHGMPLAYLSGEIPKYDHLNCVDLTRDLCYFGIRSFEEDEARLIQEKNVLVFEPEVCNRGDVYDFSNSIKNHFGNKQDKYWISFDIDCIDAGEFKSTGTAEGNGCSLDFAFNFFKKMIPQSIGLDLTEVNFALSDGQIRRNDERTVRELFEMIVSIAAASNPDSLRMPDFQMQDQRQQTRI